MAEPIVTGAAIIAGLSALKSLFGGNDPDPELMQLQKDIGQALLGEMRSTNAIMQPFRGDLSGALRQRTGSTLPIQKVGMPTGAGRFNPLGNARRRGLSGGQPEQMSLGTGGFLGGKVGRNAAGITNTTPRARNPMPSTSPMQNKIIQAIRGASPSAFSPAPLGGGNTGNGNANPPLPGNISEILETILRGSGNFPVNVP